jgi:pilus assembly protein CpaE
MPARLLARLRRADGTASVELIGVLPALLLVVLIAGQIAAAGYALWSAALAARAGARAAVVGADRGRAARRALPSLLREGAVVRGGEVVTVRVGVPRLLPALPRFDVAAGTGLSPAPHIG